MTFVVWAEIIKLFFGLVGAVAAGVTIYAAIKAVAVYKDNSKLERAKWLSNLYEKFYERRGLKEVREQIDCPTDDAQVAELISRRESNLADYLNFFQFIVYLKDNGQLTQEEIKFMFNYYLLCLKKHGNLRNYMKDNGFGQLDSFLEQWK